MTPGEAVEQPTSAAADGTVVTVALSPAATEALFRICDQLGLNYAGAVDQALQAHVRLFRPDLVNPVADAMAQAAKVNPGLPYSFVMDTLDAMDEALRQRQILGGDVDRRTFGAFLDRVVLGYLSDPDGYQINPGALPVSVL